MKKEKSAGLIVFRLEDHVPLYLLLNYSARHWDFVKGNIESGEDELEAAVRELKEETGINKVEIIEGVYNKINYFYKRNKELIYKEVVFFAGNVKNGEVKLSFEHVGYKWADFNETMKILTFKTARDVLAAVDEVIKRKYIEH